MQFFAFVILLCSISDVYVQAGLSKEEFIESFTKISTSCKTETNASDDDMAAIVAHKSSSTMEGKCLRACIMKSFGIMNADGKFVKEEAIKMADVFSKGDPEKIKVAQEVTEACENLTVSSDHCEASEQYCACMKKEAKARGVTSVEVD